MDEIVETIENKIAELPTAVKAQAEVLRSAYAAQMVEHSEAYAAMAEDLDGYLAKNGSTVEQIAANLVRVRPRCSGIAMRRAHLRKNPIDVC